VQAKSRKKSQPGIIVSFSAKKTVSQPE